MASTSLTIFDTGRISKLSAMMLAGVLACSSVMSPPVLAQDAAATQGETAEAADPTASLVLGDDLRAVFPDMTDELVVYLRQRRTRSVAINDMKGVDPKVAKVIRRTLASGLEGKGIASKATASTRISGPADRASDWPATRGSARVVHHGSTGHRTLCDAEAAGSHRTACR